MLLNELILKLGYILFTLLFIYIVFPASVANTELNIYYLMTFYDSKNVVFEIYDSKNVVFENNVY